MRGQPPKPEIAQVSVKLTSKNNPTGSTDCSGTRIARDYILTAAHCFASSKHAVVNGVSYPVADKWKHPKWNNNTDAFDFAVLYVRGLPEGPVAKLPGAAEKIKVGDQLTVAGFGYTETGSDGKLGQTSLTIKKPDYTETEILATGKGTGICGGDSGGGALKAGTPLTIVGVSSSTAGADKYGCDDHVYFANVSVVTRWIDGILKPLTNNTGGVGAER